LQCPEGSSNSNPILRHPVNHNTPVDTFNPNSHMNSMSLPIHQADCRITLTNVIFFVSCEPEIMAPLLRSIEMSVAGKGRTTYGYWANVIEQSDQRSENYCLERTAVGRGIVMTLQMYFVRSATLQISRLFPSHAAHSLLHKPVEGWDK
jgi:hypothetical protein